ncbi:DMT family transporter [Streptomyces lunaelactis]|uniref:DMT family transporter n=1 Tax=Streptomyces lunaelactis TaxID=1535768 RepID=UPI0028153F6A|nr:DMT family transporter [Streptomyces lunaelactis]
MALPAGGLESVDIDPAGLIAVVILGIFGTGFTFALNYRLIADEGATNAATVVYLTVVSITLGAVVLGEQLTFRVVAGMVAVLVGVGPARWQKRTSSPSVQVTTEASSIGQSVV